MNELFMKLLWRISDMGNIKSLNLYKDGDFATLVAEIDGKLYDITIREEETEEEKND